MASLRFDGFPGVVFFGFGSGAFGDGKTQNIENQTHKSCTN